MKSKLIFYATAASLVSCLLAASTASVADEAEKAFSAKEVFPSHAKTRWEYDVQRVFGKSQNGLAYRVNCEEGGSFRGFKSFIFVTRHLSGRRRKEVLQREHYYFDKSSNLMCYRRENGPVTVRFDPPQQIIKAQCKAGDIWTWTGKFAGNQASISYEVLAPKSFMWKKKTLSCLRIKTITTPLKSEANNIQIRTLWFAPKIGLVKEESLDKTNRVEVELTGTLHNFYPGKSE